VVSRHPVSGRASRLAGSSSKPPSTAPVWCHGHEGGGGGIELPGSDPAERKTADSNGTVSPAHPLATEPGTPVRFTFRAPPEIRTRNLFLLREATLPVGLEGHASG
jgi:hypothetical protein